MSRIPIIAAGIDRLIAERTGVYNRREYIADELVTAYIRVTSRVIPSIGVRVDTLELGSIDVDPQHVRKGILKEVLAYMEEAALKTTNIRGIFLEIVHAKEVEDFYRRSGYVDYDPNNVYKDISGVASYFKDLRPELGNEPSPTYTAYLARTSIPRSSEHQP